MHPTRNLSWHGSGLEGLTAAEYASNRWRATSSSFSHQQDPTKRAPNGKKHRTNARFRLSRFTGDPFIEIAKPARLCRLQVLELTTKIFPDAAKQPLVQLLGAPSALLEVLTNCKLPSAHCARSWQN